MINELFRRLGLVFLSRVSENGRQPVIDFRDDAGSDIFSSLLPSGRQLCMGDVFILSLSTGRFLLTAAQLCSGSAGFRVGVTRLGYQAMLTWSVGRNV